MADEFATAVTFLEVKDEKYRRQLKADEAFTTQSAGKMNAALNTVTLKTGGLQTAASSASPAVSALGSAAALSGNQMVNAAAQAGTLLLALAPLGPIMLAIGSAASILGGAYALLTAAHRKLQEQAKEEEDRLKAEVVATKALADTEEKLVASLTKRLRIMRGAKESAFLTGAARDVQLQIENIQRLARVRVRSESRGLAAFRKELAAQQKLVALEKERTAEARRLRMERVAARQADVRAGLTGGRAPTSATEARSQLIQASTLLDKQKESRLLFLREARTLLAAGFDAKSLQAVLRGMGIVFEGAKAVIGSIGVSAFRGRTDIAAPSTSPAQVQSEKRDQDRNTSLASIDRQIGDLITRLTVKRGIQ